MPQCHGNYNPVKKKKNLSQSSQIEERHGQRRGRITFRITESPPTPSAPEVDSLRSPLPTHRNAGDYKTTSVGAPSHIFFFLLPEDVSNTVNPQSPPKTKETRASWPRISVPALRRLGEAPVRERWEEAARTTRVC